jgi:hypothetical protein
MPKSKKTPSKKKKKPPTQSKLKQKLDSLFSQYIRLTYADDHGMVECYTCGKVRHWKRIQNGHFMSRGYLNTRFDERNVRPQCVGCNIYGRGKVADFSVKLEKETPGITIELAKEARIIHPNYNYQGLIEH